MASRTTASYCDANFGFLCGFSCMLSRISTSLCDAIPALLCDVQQVSTASLITSVFIAITSARLRDVRLLYAMAGAANSHSAPYYCYFLFLTLRRQVQQASTVTTFTTASYCDARSPVSCLNESSKPERAATFCSHRVVSTVQYKWLSAQLATPKILWSDGAATATTSTR